MRFDRIDNEGMMLVQEIRQRAPMALYELPWVRVTENEIWIVEGRLAYQILHTGSVAAYVNLRAEINLRRCDPLEALFGDINVQGIPPYVDHAVWEYFFERLPTWARMIGKVRPRYEEAEAVVRKAQERLRRNGKGAREGTGDHAA